MNGDINNSIHQNISTNSTYSGGVRYASTDNGSSWSIQATNDATFYITFDYIAAKLVETGLTDDDHDIQLSINDSYAHLYIDGSESDNATVTEIVDTSDNWTVGGPTILYFNTVNISKGGTPVFGTEWSYASNLVDTVGGHALTASFRTASSDPDVSAEFISFTPVSTATTDNETTATWPSIMDDAPDLPDTTYSEEERPGIFFEPVIHALATAADLPDSLFWYPFAFVIIIGTGMIVYYALASKGTNALFFKIVTQLAFMIFFALPGLNIFGFFVPLYHMVY